MAKKINVKIGEKEVELKVGLAALLKFEELYGLQMADIKTTNDAFKFYHCIWIACTRKHIEFEDFCDLFDENPILIEQFNTLMVGE